jgi:hypothetical protein
MLADQDHVVKLFVSVLGSRFCRIRKPDAFRRAFSLSLPPGTVENRSNIGLLQKHRDPPAW